MKLDVTETSIVAQRFAPRDGLSFTLGKPDEKDQSYFYWLNRLNLVLGWKKFTFGLRIDSSLYALRPEDQYADVSPQNASTARGLAVDGATRFRNSIYPAKAWLGYKNGGLEITAGDSYVQFGRGLILSLRKVDELGIDTTLFGGKITVQKDPFGMTLIAGFANPAKNDEPTARALLPSAEVPRTATASGIPTEPLFGSDRIIGAQLQAGRGLPVILSTHAVRVTKCAPFSYNADGNIETSTYDDTVGRGLPQFGTCDEADRLQWLDQLKGLLPSGASRETTNLAQSIEVPSLWGHGSIYVEGAVQKREPVSPAEYDMQGNALYGSVVSTGGPVSNTLEVKSYRNFYPLVGSVNITRASAFSNIAYSIPPTTEPIIADSMFGNFNVCVTGGRDRFDYRFTPTFLGYATFGYWYSRSEIFGGSCDRFGKSTAEGKVADTTNYITDGSLGIEWRFDDDKSIIFANVSARNDVRDTDVAYYRELATQYSITKYIKGPYALEFTGRHRYRIQDGENIRDASSFRGEPWRQGEHYNALKIAPKWVISQGFEYTTSISEPVTYYLNGTVIYRFTSDSNVRINAGQNRGGLRCVSGICRVFPAFSGARVELTLRF